MIFGECDNNSLTLLGKHKNVILFVRWRHKGAIFKEKKKYLLWYFRPCHFTYSHRPIIFTFSRT